MSALKRVLISEPDSTEAVKIEKIFKQNNVQTMISSCGRDCQLQVYREQFDSVVLDLDTRDHSSIEVLRYLRSNFPHISVIFTVRSMGELAAAGMSVDILKKIGVREVFTKPIDAIKLIDCFEGKSELEAWKDTIGKDKTLDDTEMNSDDGEFDSVHVNAFTSSGLAIMDYFLRLGPGRYVKVLNRGDKFQDQDVSRLIKEKSVEHLYFNKSDRARYVNYVNELLEQAVQVPNLSPNKVMKKFEDVVDKFLGEVQASGVNKDMFDEGLKICNNMFSFLQRQSDVMKVLSSLEERSYQAHELQFLTTMYSALISQGISWSSRRTIEYVCMGSLLHGLGKLRLSDDLLKKSYQEMTALERVTYQTYPALGLELLSTFSCIPTPVQQVVYQHRECINGEGFPNQLTFARIYPLAKIVGVANRFSELLIQEKMAPLEGLRNFVTDRQMVEKYDAESMKALIGSFITKNKGICHEK